MEDQKPQNTQEPTPPEPSEDNLQISEGNPDAISEGRARSLANLRPPWKAGEPSANPKGRPKGLLSFNTRLNMAIDRLAEEYVKQHNTKRQKQLKEGASVDDVPPEMSVDDVDIMGDVFAKYVNAARNGDLKTAKDLLDRAYGKAVQKVELGGIEGNPLVESKMKAAQAEAEAWERAWNEPEPAEEATAAEETEPEEPQPNQTHASPDADAGTTG